MSVRTERVAKLLQREIADILQTDLSEQLPALFTVTNARVTKDLGIAYIDVSVYGSELSERKASFKHLQDMTPQVRSILAGRIRHQMRSIPEVRFFLDESLHEAKKMDALFDRIRAERAHRTGDDGVDVEGVDDDVPADDDQWGEGGA